MGKETHNNNKKTHPKTKPNPKHAVMYQIAREMSKTPIANPTFAVDTGNVKCHCPHECSLSLHTGIQLHSNKIIFYKCKHLFSNDLGEGLAPDSRDSSFDPSHFTEPLLKAVLPKGLTETSLVHLITFYINMKINSHKS